MTSTAIPAALRAVIYERDQNLCQRCGRFCVLGPHSLHHRRPRQMGGDSAAHTAANLVLLCGTGTTGCHGEVESFRTQAYAQGWLVHRWDDPATTPVLRFGRTRAIPGEHWSARLPPAPDLVDRQSADPAGVPSDDTRRP